MLFRSWLVFACLLLISVSAGSGEEKPARRALLKGKLLMKSGVTKWDRSLMLQAKALFEQAIDDSAFAREAQYALGYACYRLANYALQSREKREAKAMLDTATIYLQNALRLDETDAEARALLAMCYAQQAGLQRTKALAFGRRSKQLIEAAGQQAPANPRVALLRGLIEYHTPAMLGGNKKHALERMQHATALFAVWQPPNEIAPNWGRAEAYAWLCRFYLDAGDTARAKSACQQALAINPAYIWVKQSLLPMLEK